LIGGVLGFYWLRSSDVFAVTEVSFPVVERVTEAELRAVIEELAGVNLLRLSTNALEADLAKIPYVRSARVYRRFPDTIEIDIEEYAPAARVRDGEGVEWLVADDGMVLEKAGASSHGLSLLVPEANESPQPGIHTSSQVTAAIPLTVMLKEAAAWPSSVHPVSQVSVLRSGEVVMVLQGGGEIRLGDPGKLDEKLKVALEVIDRYSKDGKQLDYVDVHVTTRVVAKAR
jgi:cell division protein FtsQ